MGERPASGVSQYSGEGRGPFGRRAGKLAVALNIYLIAEEVGDPAPGAGEGAQGRLLGGAELRAVEDKDAVCILELLRIDLALDQPD